jgi:proteasome accessory factor B
MAAAPKVPQSRPPLERMLRIHGLLQHGKRPNCSTLAKQLEVSVKTAQRDIEFMRDRLNLPIDYDRTTHGYFYTEPVTNFPTVQVSEGEVVALLVAQKAMEQYRGTPFEKMLRTAVQKLAAGLADDISFGFADLVETFSFHTLGVAPVDPTVFERLAQAVRTRRETSFDYTKLKTGRTEARNVRPYHLVCLEQCWYLIAHDCARDALRLFALPRIKSVRLGRKTFVRPATFSARDHLANSFGAYAGATTQEVKIEFDTFAAPYIRERIWHESQKLKSQSAGGLVLTMKISRLVQVTSWVLSWGGHAKVIEPPNMRDKVAAEAAAILSNQKRPPDSIYDPRLTSPAHRSDP